MSSSSSSPSSSSGASSSTKTSGSNASSATRKARLQLTQHPYGLGASSDSSSDGSSFSGDEREKALKNKKQTKKVEPKKSRPAPKATKRKQSESSEDEAYEEFKHLFDTKAEYLDCMNKTEKEKEEIIYEKMELYDKRKERERIEATLAARARGEELPNSNYSAPSTTTEKKKGKARGAPPRKQAPKKPVSSDDSDTDMDAEFHQPTDIARKKQQKTAMASLAQKRKEKERKQEKKKASLSVDAVFGKGGSDSSNSSDDDSSSTSSASSVSSSSSSENEPVVVASRPVETLHELKKAQVSRKLLRILVFTPQLAEVVVGGYVLIRSVEMKNSPNEFHIWKVLEVMESGKPPYKLEDIKTAMLLKCRWGDREKTIPFSFVSNQYFKEEEFIEYKTVNAQDLPTIEFLSNKEQIIKLNKTPQYTKEVVEHMVREKKKFGLSHMNFALTKSELIGKRTTYENNNDRAMAAEVQRQIDDLDRKASELEKKRVGDIAHVNMINKKNRQQQSNKFFGQHSKLMTADTEEENPFTRKKERMRVVCGTSKTADLFGSNAVKEAKITVVKEDKPVAPPMEIKKEEPKARILTLAEKIKLSNSGQPKKKEPVDVFSLHNAIEFDFDFELPLAPKNAGKSSNSRQKSSYY